MVKIECNGYQYLVELIDGVPQGKGVSYYDKGIVQMEGMFKDGKLHGEHLSFSPKGELIEQTFYVNGSLTGNFIGYYLVPTNERVKRYEGVYLDGRIHGIFTTYFPNGNVSSKVEYIYGEKNGTEITYFMTEKYKISSAKIYDMGIKKQYVLYDIDGKLLEFSEFKSKYFHLRRFDDSLMIENFKEFSIDSDIDLCLNIMDDNVIIFYKENELIQASFSEIIDVISDDETLNSDQFKKILNVLRAENIC